MALKLIHGTKPPDTPKQRVIDGIRRMPKPPTVLQCPRCGGRDVLELRTGAMVRNRKVVGGTKQVVCAHCYMKGERVMLA